METIRETIDTFLITDDSQGLESYIDNVLKNNVRFREDWVELIKILQKACREIFQKHWLKTHHIILSIFGMSELAGVDCPIFDVLRSIETPKNIHHASRLLFDGIIEKVSAQLKNGGSTLFLDIEAISSTRSAIIASDLIQARYRETILVLGEIDEKLPTLTKEWVDVSRLWRTGNGFRLLKARELGIHIHIKEYKEIRDLLTEELKVDAKKLSKERTKLIKKGSRYLQFSKSLSEFVDGLIASRGIRGSFDPYYKTWIDHEGLDEF